MFNQLTKMVAAHDQPRDCRIGSGINEAAPRLGAENGLRMVLSQKTRSSFNEVHASGGSTIVEP
jgi:hypothetical protein